jgi:predicted ATPase
MLGSKAEAKKFHAFMKHVGKASGLFQDVRIKNFGKGATAPFEVDVVLDGKGLSLSTVGYGVSQSLPVLVEILARGPGTWLAIQQPEVHLHPRAQAALGEVLFEMAARYSQVFLVETHSDFTIDRFRMNYRTERADKPEGQVLFFERREKHNVVTSLPISASGDFPTDQPQRYRDFFVKEEMRLLGI